MSNRKQYVIDKAFQIRLVKNVILLIAFAVIVSGILTFLVSLNLESRNTRKIYGARIEAQDDIVLLERLMILKPIVIKYILIASILTTTISIILLLIYFHRIAGPIYSLKLHLDRMIEGDFSKILIFRDNDEFKEIAEKINILQKRLVSKEVENLSNSNKDNNG